MPATSTRQDRLYVEDTGSGERRLLLEMGQLNLIEKDRVTKDFLERTPGRIYFFEFSFDDRRIYYLSDAWGNERGLFSVELATGATRYVMGAANYFNVIDDCQEPDFLGKIVVRSHLTEVGPSPRVVDWFYVMDEQATRVGVVGPTFDDVETFMARRCGVGSATPPRRRAQIPPSLRRQTRCGSTPTIAVPIKLLGGDIIDLLVFGRRSTFWQKSNIEEMLQRNCSGHLPRKPPTGGRMPMGSSARVDP